MIRCCSFIDIFEESVDPDVLVFCVRLTGGPHCVKRVPNSNAKKSSFWRWLLLGSNGSKSSQKQPPERVARLRNESHELGTQITELTNAHSMSMRSTYLRSTGPFFDNTNTCPKMPSSRTTARKMSVFNSNRRSSGGWAP
jgi:hypothetical protein